MEPSDLSWCRAALDAPPLGSGSFTHTAKPERRRVGLLLQHGRQGPTSSGFVRLLAPLTTELAARHLGIAILESVEDPGIAGCDICVVQRVAVSTSDEATFLVSKLRELGIPLFVDTDDAFSALPVTHPEREVYAGKDAALRQLMRAAQGVWFSTSRLAAMYPEAAATAEIIGNNLDARLWRSPFEEQTPAPGPAECVRFLYMGTPTHDADFGLLLPPFDQLWEERPGSFSVTLIGAVRRPPAREWIRSLPPPKESVLYPRFVRWLQQQGPFDAGLAPLVNNEFNSAKSDIKVLDYAALGLITVASDVSAYSRLPCAAGLVRRCDNTTTAWHAALSRLMEERGELQRLGREASAYVWRERSSNVTCSQLLAHLLRGERGPAPQRRQSPSTT